MFNNQKLAYLAFAIRKQLLRQDLECPCCGHRHAATIARKHLVTALKRCGNCQLQFRVPTTTPEENELFYQKKYTQGAATEVPNLSTLYDLKNQNFKGSAVDFKRYISLVQLLAPVGSKLFDFGCSWGYGSYQFSRAGYRVDAFEVSVPRREYARNNLGVEAHSSLPTPTQAFDIFFSAHVLEHVPSVIDSINYGMEMLKPGGYFIAFTPNGSAAHRAANPVSWMKLWGLVHPNYLDEEFYIRNLKNYAHFITSHTKNIDEIEQWTKNFDSRCLLLDGEELLIVAKK